MTEADRGYPRSGRGSTPDHRPGIAQSAGDRHHDGHSAKPVTRGARGYPSRAGKWGTGWRSRVRTRRGRWAWWSREAASVGSWSPAVSAEGGVWRPAAVAGRRWRGRCTDRWGQHRGERERSAGTCGAGGGAAPGLLFPERSTSPIGHTHRPTSLIAEWAKGP